MINEYFRVDKNFDVVSTDFKTAGRRAKLYFIDGFINSDTSELVMNYMMRASASLPENVSPEDFKRAVISYIELDISDDMDAIAKVVYSGAMLIIIDGFDTGFLIKTRSFPQRSICEPDNDKVLLGAHDGFVESVLVNTSLIRRRIRDRYLTMEVHKAGKRSKTDIVLCYLENKVNHEELDRLRKKIDSVEVNTLAFGQESVTECLVRKQRLNPFPKVRYTERPDTAAAGVAEGGIAILVDNSPVVMMTPTSFFEFIQDTNDFYLSPIVGTYLRMMRILIFGLSLFLSPVWFLLVRNPEWIPQWLDFITVKQSCSVPVLAQLLIIEVVIDSLKMASLNTPNALSNSFSVIGALVLGDLAVTARLFAPEVVLIMAFVAIANFAQSSYEMGYAFKLSRILIVCLTAAFNLKGFVLGTATVILTMCMTKTVTGRSYLYPLFPFKWKELSTLFVRHYISKDNN